MPLAKESLRIKKAGGGGGVVRVYRVWGFTVWVLLRRSVRCSTLQDFRPTDILLQLLQ